MSLKIKKFTAVITTDGEGTADGGDDGNNDTGDNTADDLTGLFSPEEIEAKKSALTESKAEEDRRAALSDEERTAEDTAKAEAAAANSIPENYELKIPDGYTIDKGLMDEVSQYAKDNKLTAAAAQQIADLGTKLLQKQQEQRETQFTDIKAKWLQDAISDKEIGADVQKGKDSMAARAFNTMATPEMKAFVDQYGIGNHPDMVRIFFRVSQVIGEDGLHMPGSGAGLGKAEGVAGTVSSIFNHPSRNQ